MEEAIDKGLTTLEIHAIEQKLRLDIANDRTLTLLQVLLGSAVIPITIPTVLTNFLFGGTFAQNVVIHFKPHLNGTDTIEAIRYPFASSSAVVNGIINANSLSLAIPMIAGEVIGVLTAEKKFKALGILLGKCVFITLAAIPNWQMVTDSFKGANVQWSPTSMHGIKITTCMAAGALAFRGADGAVKSLEYAWAMRVFPYIRRRQDAAAAFKKIVLSSLLDNVEPQDHDALSKGYRYDYSLTKYAILKFLSLSGTAVYTCGAYFGSTDEAMVNLLNITSHSSKFLDVPRYTIDIITTAARLFLLCNVASYIADQALSIKTRDRLTNQFVPFFSSSFPLVVAVALIAASSLTGAMDSVNLYLFGGSQTTAALLLAIIFTLWGASGINFLDTLNRARALLNIRTLFCGSSDEIANNVTKLEMAAKVVDWKPSEALRIQQEYAPHSLAGSHHRFQNGLNRSDPPRRRKWTNEWSC